jgi:hypothetical protein
MPGSEGQPAGGTWDHGPWPRLARVGCSPRRPADTRHARPHWQLEGMSWLDPTGRSERMGGDAIDMPPELPGGPPSPVHPRTPGSVG